MSDQMILQLAYNERFCVLKTKLRPDFSFSSLIKLQMILSKVRQQTKSHYRSIQYRSVSTDIKANKLQIDYQRLPLFNLKKTPSLKQTVSSRCQQNPKQKLLFKSEENLKNLNISLSKSLSKNNQKQFNSTLFSYGNPEQEFLNTFGESTYLQTFQDLMQLQARKDSSSRKMGPILQKLKSIKDRNKLDRISLPNIIEYENSQFTALDPINIPIQSLKELIYKTRLQIEKCPNELLSIRCDMRQYKSRYLNELESFEVEYLQKVKRLRMKLSQNSVYQQSFLLGTRRQVQQLEQFIPQFKSEFVETHLSQNKLQKVIFQTEPFELTLLEQEIQVQQKNKSDGYRIQKIDQTVKPNTRKSGDFPCQQKRYFSKTQSIYF